MWLLARFCLFGSFCASIASATSLTQSAYSADSLRRETLDDLAVLLEREAKSMKSMAATIRQQHKMGGAPGPMEEHEVESAEIAAQAGTELLQTAEAASAQLRGSTSNLEAPLNLDELDANETKFSPAAGDASVLGSRRRRRSLSEATLHTQLIQEGSALDSALELQQSSELTAEEKRLQVLLERR